MPVVLQKRLLDVKTAARYLSIGTTLLYQWIKAGKIPCLKMNTKTLIDVNDLDQFVDDLKIEQEPKKGV
jgi:excisionase family DNA binding protein